MANDYVFDRDSKMKFFPELHRSIEKFEYDEWDNDIVWTFYTNADDEYGDTYEIWIDECGNYRWDYVEPDDEDDEMEAWEDYYTPSASRGDYSPSCPWNAPGMSIHDFI